MTEQRSAALQCWDACLQYEISRAEVMCSVLTSTYYNTNDWLKTSTEPSIMDGTVVVALHHIARDYLKATQEEIKGMLRSFKRLKAGAMSDVDSGRLSLRGFTALLDSLPLVSNVENVLSTLWKKVLQIDERLARCALEEINARTTAESEETKAREHLLSSSRRWEQTRMLQERLKQQRIHMETLRSLSDEGIADRQKISLIRRAVRVEEEWQQRQTTTEASRMERVVHISGTVETLHDQLRVLHEYEALALSPLMGEMTDKIAYVISEDFRGNYWEERLSLLERQLGTIGRSLIGLSVMNVGRREHEMILRRMRDTTVLSSTNAIDAVAAGDLSWLIGEDGDSLNSYYASKMTMLSERTDGDGALPLQQCMLDVSYYRAKEGEIPARGWEIPSADERCDIEGILRETFNSLTYINYMAIPFLQKDVATLDAVVIFPSFELFVTQCEMSVIGSGRLAFFRYCSQRLDTEIVTYMKSLVREEGNWIAEYGMCYDDFLVFLVNQASVEYVQHAYLLTPKRLLMNIVTDFIVPRWLTKLKINKARTRATTVSNEMRGVESVNSVVLKREDSNDLCLLLDTALTWLGIAGRSLQDFAQAYRTYVLEYAFATRPEPELGGITTTQTMMALLFTTRERSTRLRCSVSRLENLQRLYGSEFVAMTNLVGKDGSLESVAAWISLGIAGISREELVQRIIDVMDLIIKANLDDDIYADGNNGFFLGISSLTPFSWILTLAVCVRLTFASELVTLGLDELFHLLTVPK